MCRNLRRSLAAAGSAVLLGFIACTDRSVTAPKLERNGPSFAIDVATATMTFEFKYAGEELSALGLPADYCPFSLLIKAPGTAGLGQRLNVVGPNGTTGLICTDGAGAVGTITVSGLPVGDQIIQLQFLAAPNAAGNNVVAALPVLLAAGQTTPLLLDLATMVGVVKGSLTIDGRVPTGRQYAVCTFQPTPGFLQVCQFPKETSGAFAFFDLLGDRMSIVRRVGGGRPGIGDVGATISTLTYGVAAGQTFDLGAIAVETSSLTLTLSFNGTPASELGLTPSVPAVPSQFPASDCPFALFIDPPAGGNPNIFGPQVISLCGAALTAPFTVGDLPVGAHTFQLRFMGPPAAANPPVLRALVATEQVTLTAGQTAVENFDLTGVGLVKGVLTVRGGVPAANQYAVCLATFPNLQPIPNNLPCGVTDATSGAFGFFDLPGARVGMVRSASPVAFGTSGPTFNYTVVAGATTTLGTVAGDRSKISVDVRLDGDQLGGFGVVNRPDLQRYCPFDLYIDPPTNSSNPLDFGRFVGNVCANELGALVPVTVEGLAVGEHTFDLRFFGPLTPTQNAPRPKVSTVTATLAADQPTSLTFDLKETMGVVSGDLTVDGQVPADHKYLVCAFFMTQFGNGFGQPCVYAISNEIGKAHFKYLDVAGARRGQVRAPGSFVGLSEFGYTVTANGSTVIGSTTGGASGTTKAGANVSVTPVASDGTTPVTLAFTKVGAAGFTTVSPSPTGPTPPADADPVTVYYNVSTTATFSPADPVTICIIYPAGTPDPEQLRLFHYENGAWMDVTVTDPSLVRPGSVCGTVTSFSPFLIARTSRRPPVARISVSSTTAAEGSPIIFDASGSADPDGSITKFEWDWDNDGRFEASGATVPHAFDDEGPYTVGLRVTDNHNLTHSTRVAVIITNAAPVLGAIVGIPTGPIPAGSSVTLRASFSDAGKLDTHTGTITWDIGAVSETAPVTEVGGSGSVTATRVLSAGVYTVSVAVTDNGGGAAMQTGSQYIVVYDPSEGFVTGGGWIQSPAGAYAPDAALTGKATFGFVAKYQKGASAPSGNTEFEFKAGSLRFKATGYEWLVVAGSKAKYKGEGAINGAGGYGFMLTAIDGGDGADAFRLKIWNLATGSIVYDNRMGELEDSDAATALSGGSIVVHK